MSALVCACAAALLVPTATPPEPFFYREYTDLGDSPSPEIDAAAVYVLKDEPRLLSIGALIDVPTAPTGATVAASIDTDGDGRPDYLTSAPKSMVLGKRYPTVLLRDSGGRFTPTSGNAVWRRTEQAYVVKLPWKELGWKKVGWGVTVTTGATDFAPNDPPTLDLLAALTPGRVKNVRVRRSPGTTRVAWKPQRKAGSYRIQLRWPGVKRTYTTKSSKVRISTARGVVYRMTIRGKGPGGAGPARTIRFRAR